MDAGEIKVGHGRVCFELCSDGSVLVGVSGTTTYVPLTAEERETLIQFLSGETKPAPAHHSAQPGEVWDLDSTQGKTYRVVAVAPEEGEDPTTLIQPSTGDWFSVDDPLFTGGVRIL